MGLFNSLFNENKKQWLNILNDERLPVYLHNAIKDFFIPDNLDFEMYVQNQEANSIIRNHNMSLDDWENINKLSVYDEGKKPIKCSPTFRKHFSGYSFDRPMGIPDWFIIAYPDVAYWLSQNNSEIEQMFGDMMENFIEDGKLSNQFYRLTVNFYKEKISKLELAK
jgi:hypothetical protein